MSASIDLVVGYLSFVNQNNKHVRLDDLQASLSSFSKLSKSKGTTTKRFISVDNASSEEARDALGLFPWDAKAHYDKNYFDVALFYTTSWYAQEVRAPYFAWFYDDFIVYDDAFDDCVEFMEKNSDISCVRLPIYDYGNQRQYDTRFTHKSVNPDAVRHFNTVTNSPVKWEGPFVTSSGRTFYKNDWHYTSRPMMWRTDFFSKVMAQQQDVSRILQGFEMWAIHAFHNAGLRTGVLQGGMMKTTPIDRSARYLSLTPDKEMKTSVDVKELRREFEKAVIL